MGRLYEGDMAVERLTQGSYAAVIADLQEQARRAVEAAWISGFLSGLLFNAGEGTPSSVAARLETVIGQGFVTSALAENLFHDTLDALVEKLYPRKEEEDHDGKSI